MPGRKLHAPLIRAIELPRGGVDRKWDAVVVVGELYRGAGAVKLGVGSVGRDVFGFRGRGVGGKIRAAYVGLSPLDIDGRLAGP